MTIAYCVKCRKKQEMKSETHSKTKKGTAMTKGICPHCGCKMCRIGV